MKLYTLSLVLLLSIFFSCSGDNSKSAVKQALIDFTINDKNATAYKTGENLPADIVADKDYIVVSINEAIKIKVDLPDDNKLPVLWEVEDSPIQGKEIEQKFSTLGFKKIVLQVPGYEEVVKFVNVKNEPVSVPETTAPAQTPVSETEKVTSPSTPEVKIVDKKPIAENKAKPKVKADDSKKSTIPENDKPTAPVIINKGNPETVKPETKVATSSSTPPVNTKPSDFKSTKEEGAKLIEPCAEKSFTEIASVTLRPTQDVELGSIYVYTNQSGNVNIVLLENNSPVDKLSGRSVNKGRAQIRLSTLNYTLRAGKTYTLKVDGSAGVNFANLSNCNAGGGGSIMQPSYGNNVSIFNIKFNY